MCKKMNILARIELPWRVNRRRALARVWPDLHLHLLCMVLYS